MTAHTLSHIAHTQRNAYKSIINASHTDAHNIERRSRGSESLSSGSDTRGLRGLTTKQSPYAKHMRKAIGSPMETRCGSFRDSCNELWRSSSRYEARSLALYFVACCCRAINSRPAHTLHADTLGRVRGIMDRDVGNCAKWRLIAYP